jgi:hypothetical protein
LNWTLRSAFHQSQAIIARHGSYLIHLADCFHMAGPTADGADISRKAEIMIMKA